MIKPIVPLIALVLVGLFFLACGGGAPTPVLTAIPTETPEPTATPDPTATPQPTSTPRPTATSRPGVTPEPTATPTATPEPTATLRPTATPRPTPTPTIAAMVPQRGSIAKLMHSARLSHFDIHACGVFNSCLVAPAPLYNGLLEFNPETDDSSDIRGDLATDWVVADDGVTFTFTLHENARWHDGWPVTAADVVFSLERMTDPEADAEGLRPNSSNINPFYKSSRVIDDNTVEVVTNFSAAAFLPYLASEYMKIYPKHHFEGMSQDDAKLAENSLGSGPFKLTRIDKDTFFEHVRNDDYFKEGLPYWDGMKSFIIIDPGTSFSAFRVGNVIHQAGYTNNLDTRGNIRLGEAMKGKGRIEWAGGALELFVNMNVNRPPFDNVKVRQAFHLAFDRQSWIEIIYAGQDILGYPFQPGSFWAPSEAEVAKLPGWRQQNGEKHPDDILEARRLLAEGLGEAGIALEDFKPTYISIILAEFPDAGAAFVDQVNRALDIGIKHEPMELLTAVGLIYGRNFEMSGLGHPALVLDPSDFISGAYLATGRSNPSGWSDPRVDELFDLQASELDPQRRKVYIDEISQIVVDRGPFVLQNWNFRGMYVDNRIQNFHVTPGESFQLKMEHLWCDPACN